MISLSNISKTYSNNGIKNIVIDDVNFEFPVDRNVAIMGKNGAGKSTLMRLIAGAEQPDRGRIFRSSKISWPLGFSGGFNGSMTGTQNIIFVSRIYGQDIPRVIDYVKEFSELGDFLRQPIKTYSSGMKARLAFGLSMAIDFDTYLIDEITAVGDANFKKKSQAVFKDRLKNSQIIMVSHSIGTLREYCDCGVLLDKGKFRFYETMEELFSAYDAVNANG